MNYGDQMERLAETLVGLLTTKFIALDLPLSIRLLEVVGDTRGSC